MEQLIFVAIIIVFSILDSVARTKKKREAGGLPVPEAPEEWERDTEEDSFDPSASYDEVDVRRAPEETEPARPSRTMQPYEPPGGGSRTQPTSSEGMVPADLWAEIAGLAKSRSSAQSRPAPRPQVEVEAPPPPPPPRPVETHRVHRSHAGFGTDPSTRAKSEQDGLDPLAAALGVDASSARHQVRSRDRHALRQAVILQEILSPPAALRPDPFEGG